MKTTRINNKHYQECDVIILPVKKHHAIFELDNKLSQEFSNYTHKNPQELYILSNDEIKDTDVVFDGHSVWMIQIQPNTDLSKYKKVISSTDKIWKSLSQIPQSFIEHYITEYNKGNVISKVLVELQMYKGSVPVTWVSSLNETDVNFSIKLNQNEISILTEQKQETLEEASENWLNKDGFNIYNHYDTRPSFIAGAKWQAERMYSREEELKLIDKLLRDFRSDCLPLGKYPDYILLNFKNKWIEQNLK